MPDTASINLFGEATDSTVTSLFAEIVFDRPLDHAYSYGVPDALREQVAVGKRVLAPFGRGDRQTIGFCVGVSTEQPSREVKNIVQVLDEQALLTPHLLRLTRWLADYYLCAWGQVLNAVVPAGVKDRAGTRNVLYVEAIPELLWPKPVPGLTPKQKKVPGGSPGIRQADRDQSASAACPMRRRSDPWTDRQGPGASQGGTCREPRRRGSNGVECAGRRGAWFGSFDSDRRSSPGLVGS